MDINCLHVDSVTVHTSNTSAIGKITNSPFSWTTVGAAVLVTLGTKRRVSTHLYHCVRLKRNTMKVYGLSR